MEKAKQPVGTELEGFPAVLARAWIWGRRILWGVLVGGTALVVLNGIHLYGLLGAVHPWVARGTFLVLGVLLALLAVSAGWRYLRTPRVLLPPDLPASPADWNDAQREVYRRFAIRYLKRQQDNPHLPEDSRRQIPAALETVGATPAAGLHAVVESQVDAILAPLDVLADVQIRRTAVQVATATAVSPSVMLDSLITLSRNIDLIARLADLYYGRPGLLGTLRVARDVIGSAVAAGALELVSEHVSGALAEMTGSWSARLIGPLGQGMVNGVVTMRFGAAARFRCRSLSRRRVPWRPWHLTQYRRAFVTLTRWITAEAGPSVAGPLGKFVDWTGRATGKTLRGGRKLVATVRESFGAGEGPAPVVAEPGEDPLLDSKLMY